MQELSFAAPRFVGASALFVCMFALSVGAQTAVPDRVVATINGDPRYEMGFNWRTSADDEAEVHVVEKACWIPNVCSDSSYIKKFTVSETGKTYGSYRKAKATGLSPDTEYFYYVGSDAGWSKVGRFKTAPLSENDGFSFLYTSDIHVDSVGNSVAKRTVRRALNRFAKLGKHASFWLMTGDHVNNYPEPREWNTVFVGMQSVFYRVPLASVIGNHDVKYPIRGRYRGTYRYDSLFNTAGPVTALSSEHPAKESVYSFVYGNALFLALHFEDGYDTPEKLGEYRAWMTGEIERQKEVHGVSGFRWIIAYAHKGVFTAGHNTDDIDMKNIRAAMAPIYRDLGVDLSIQGHNHIYEVIGPVTRDGKLVNAKYITGRIPIGKSVSYSKFTGGRYDVTEGTMYFCNGSAGHKFGLVHYTVRKGNRPNMDDGRIFTGRLSKMNMPTYSIIDVTDEEIAISTYAIPNRATGREKLFDRFTIVKPKADNDIYH